MFGVVCGLHAGERERAAGGGVIFGEYDFQGDDP